MSNVVGKSGNAKQPTAIGALQLQTAQRGGVIPIVYGTARVAPNIIQFDGFKGVPVQTSGGKGKGGGGKSGSGQASTTFNYQADVIFGLCQGPIAGIGQIWENNSIGDLSQFTPFAPATIALGADGQAIDPNWEATFPATARHYSGTAYISAFPANLGTSAVVPAVQAEVITTFTGAGSTGQDADPAHLITDFLTNPRYGAGFPLGSLAPLEGVNGTGFGEYCIALGIGLSPQIDEMREANQHLADITKICNSAIVWSGGLLKIIPYGDTTLASQFVWTITFVGGDLHSADTFTVTISDPAIGTLAIPFQPFADGEHLPDFVGAFAEHLITAGIAEYGIVVSAVNKSQNVIAGTPLPPGSNPGVDIDTITLIQQPGLFVGGVGTTVITVSGPGRDATISVSKAGGGSPGAYVPNVTPVYDLGSDDFIVQASTVGTGSLQPGGHALRPGATPVTGGFSEDPVTVTRSSPADAVNYIKAEWSNRANSYNVEVVDAWDQAAIDQYGFRMESPFKARAIADPVTAAVCAQLALNRAQLYRNTYTFRLGWRYALLEPMDLVTLTEPRLGFDKKEVRVTGVEEDDEGTLTVTAEDFVVGYSSVPLYPKNIPAGYQPNWNVPATAVHGLVTEPPADLGQFQLWVAAAAPGNVGSIQAWISSDGSSYALMGTLPGVATMGTTTADLPAGADVDTVNALALDMSISEMQLTSVSASDAHSGVTLSWIGNNDGTGGELFAYTTATLTAVNQYSLTRLYRGLQGSPNIDHPTGSAFLFVDANPTIGKFSYPSPWVGQTVYIKFLAGNTTGGGFQTLDQVQAYPYTLTGGEQLTYPVFIENYYGPSTPTASQIANPFVAGVAIDFNPEFGTIAGGTSVGRADVAATATAVFTVQQSLAGSPNVWTNIGTVTFAAGQVTPTFVTGSGAAVSLAVGDTIRVVAPSTPDATLAGVVITLAGSR